mgnify:CR=1 FL=1
MRAVHLASLPPRSYGRFVCSGAGLNEWNCVKARRDVEPREPGRRLGADRAETPRFHGETHGLDLGRDPLDLDQAAPVERLDGGVLLHAGLAHFVYHDLDEFLRRYGLVRPRRIDLGLEVVAPVLAAKRIEFGKRREALAIDRFLLGQPPAVLRLGIEPADIEALEFVEREADQSWPRRLDPFAVGIAYQIRVQPRIVAQHHDAVSSDAEIAFEGDRSQRHGLTERRQRVLRRQAAAASVCLQVECRSRYRAQRPEDAGGRHQPNCPQ